MRERRGGGGGQYIIMSLALVHLLLQNAFLGGRTNVASQLWELSGCGPRTQPGLSVWACHFMNVLSHVCYHLEYI